MVKQWPREAIQLFHARAQGKYHYRSPMSWNSCQICDYAYLCMLSRIFRGSWLWSFLFIAPWYSCHTSCTNSILARFQPVQQFICVSPFVIWWMLGGHGSDPMSAIKGQISLQINLYVRICFMFPLVKWSSGCLQAYAHVMAPHPVQILQYHARKWDWLPDCDSVDDIIVLIFTSMYILYQL